MDDWSDGEKSKYDAIELQFLELTIKLKCTQHLLAVVEVVVAEVDSSYSWLFNEL